MMRVGGKGQTTFYGDPYPLQRWPERLGVSIYPMSTGLVRIFTSAGFVVGADGLMMRTTTEGNSATVEKEAVQKIFPLQQRGRELLYALTGTVGITSDKTGEIGFDFLAEANTAVNSMANLRESTLYGYVTKVCRAINMRLRAAKSVGAIGTYPTSPHVYEGELGETIAEIFFDGYYGGLPATVRGRFFHEDQRQPKTEVVVESLSDTRIYGSTKIAHALYNTTDPRFDKYRLPPLGPNGRISLETGVSLVQNYFRACADPVAFELDPQSCSAIGGHIHIARVTPQAGFEWIIPPKETV